VRKGKESKSKAGRHKVKKNGISCDEKKNVKEDDNRRLGLRDECTEERKTRKETVVVPERSITPSSSQNDDPQFDIQVVDGKIHFNFVKSVPSVEVMDSPPSVVEGDIVSSSHHLCEKLPTSSGEAGFHTNMSNTECKKESDVKIIGVEDQPCNQPDTVTKTSSLPVQFASSSKPRRFIRTSVPPHASRLYDRFRNDRRECHTESLVLPKISRIDKFKLGLLEFFMPS